MQFPKFDDVRSFIHWEEEQPERYEFAEGVISLLPGSSLSHELIVVNVATALRVRLGPGRVRGSDLKHVTTRSSRYADISVGDAGSEPLDATFSERPTLLIEVLSKSTQAVDRGPKFDEYRSLATLQEYVLIDSRKRWAQTIRRSGDDWIVSLPIVEGELGLESLGVHLTFDEIYAGTNV